MTAVTRAQLHIPKIPEHLKATAQWNSQGNPLCAVCYMPIMNIKKAHRIWLDRSSLAFLSDATGADDPHVTFVGPTCWKRNPLLHPLEVK